MHLATTKCSLKSYEFRDYVSTTAYYYLLNNIKKKIYLCVYEDVRGSSIPPSQPTGTSFAPSSSWIQKVILQYIW